MFCIDASASCYRNPTTGVSLGARGYHKSLRVKSRGSQKQRSPPVAGGTARPSKLPQDNQAVLKKLREIKLGARIDHEKYYLMIVIDGIDFLWAQTCKLRTDPGTIRFDGASEFGKSSSFITSCQEHGIVESSTPRFTLQFGQGFACL